MSVDIDQGSSDDAGADLGADTGDEVDAGNTTLPEPCSVCEQCADPTVCEESLECDRSCMSGSLCPVETFEGLEALEGTEQGDYMFFGHRVAMSDDGGTMAVAAFNYPGAIKFDTNGDFAPDPDGAGVIMVRDVCGRTTHLRPQASQDENLGESIALSGDGLVLAIGQPKTPEGGQVLVYRRNSLDEAFDDELTIVNPNSMEKHLFGQTVALSPDGSTLLISRVGAPEGQGRIFVFEWRAELNGYRQNNAIRAPSPSVLGMGHAMDVSWSEKLVVIGAPNSLVGGKEGHGAVYVFDFSSGWVGDPERLLLPTDDPAFQTYANGEKGNKPNGDPILGSLIGSSVSISEDGLTLAAGAATYQQRVGQEDVETGAVIMWTRPNTSSSWGEGTVYFTYDDSDQPVTALLGQSVAVVGYGEVIAAAPRWNGVAAGPPMVRGELFLLERGREPSLLELPSISPLGIGTSIATTKHGERILVGAQSANVSNGVGDVPNAGQVYHIINSASERRGR